MSKNSLARCVSIDESHFGEQLQIHLNGKAARDSTIRDGT